MPIPLVLACSLSHPGCPVLPPHHRLPPPHPHNAKVDEDTIKELSKSTGKMAICLKVNLADLKSVKSAAEVKSRETELDVLFNNDGVMSPWELVTADGYNLQFGTTILGPKLLRISSENMNSQAELA
ncbi:hypothetical protein DFH08DRAFT_822312 [Mycena albidolilacea]|uniref:Uncharacterized protein n=1 Tax=Mycena albidolilacea TaxID=1033008 RepID=A0AAD6Z8E5_9AGAR|nr:hypothetical protein DFH08DRAFT_822312 [Mycena albidolilacea]